jgi:hypothetical protein
MINDKIIQRAMAKSMVHDTSSVVVMVNKYYPAGYNISMMDLLLIVQDLLATNENFAHEYAGFLLKHKYLTDYNNYDRPIGAVVTGVVTVVGSLINSGASRTASTSEMQTESAKAQASNTQQLMNFMMLEEQAEMQKQKQKSTLIYLAIAAMVVITGIFLFKSE